jgi:hypothetical protein
MVSMDLDPSSQPSKGPSRHDCCLLLKILISTFFLDPVKFPSLQNLLNCDGIYPKIDASALQKVVVDRCDVPLWRWSWRCCCTLDQREVDNTIDSRLLERGMSLIISYKQFWCLIPITNHVD